MKTVKPSTTKPNDKGADAKPAVKIQTDFPLSEKDEVKKAEHQLNKASKKDER